MCGVFSPPVAGGFGFFIETCRVYLHDKTTQTHLKYMGGSSTSIIGGHGPQQSTIVYSMDCLQFTCKHLCTNWWVYSFLESWYAWIYLQLCIDLKIHIGIHTSQLYTRHGMYLSNWKRILHKRIANRHYTTYPSRNGMDFLNCVNIMV